MRIGVEKIGDHFGRDASFESPPAALPLDRTDHHIRKLIIDDREFLNHLLAELGDGVGIDFVIRLDHHLDIELHLLLQLVGQNLVQEMGAVELSLPLIDPNQTILLEVNHDGLLKF